jgi:uncharacterized membrane protein
MWLILIGVIGAAAAAIFGVLDLLNLPRHTAAFNTRAAARDSELHRTGDLFRRFHLALQHPG